MLAFLQYLESFGESWGLMPSGSALSFLSNHDNQRGHGGGGNVITFEDPYSKLYNARMSREIQVVDQSAALRRFNLIIL